MFGENFPLLHLFHIEWMKINFANAKFSVWKCLLRKKYAFFIWFQVFFLQFLDKLWSHTPFLPAATQTLPDLKPSWIRNLSMSFIRLCIWSLNIDINKNINTDFEFCFDLGRYLISDCVGIPIMFSTFPMLQKHDKWKLKFTC